MTTYHQSSADGLNRTFAQFGVPAGVTATDDGVLIPAATAQQILSSISSIEGGSRVPFIRLLLHSRTPADVTLRGDEPRHLLRAVDDLQRQKRRNEQIDRGLIPGALSSSEVTRLMRRHPRMFSRGTQGKS